jgi:hypothetical protein
MQGTYDIVEEVTHDTNIDKLTKCQSLWRFKYRLLERSPENNGF